jgi:hypothetical protein
MKNEPIRLTGSDRDIAAIARRAWRIVASSPESRGVLPALEQLGRERRAFMARLATPTVPAGGVAPPASERGRKPIGWYVLFGVGLLAAVIAAAFAGPVTKRIVLDPESTVPLIFTAGVVAMVVLGAALATWPWARHRSSTAVTLAVVAGLAVLAVVVFRFVVGPGGGATELTATQFAWWQATGIVLVLELAALAMLVRPARDDDDRSIGAGTRADGRRLRADAARLAETDVPHAVRSTWEKELGAIGDADAAAVAQARELGPVAWLVWSFYDGELDVSAVARG